MYSDPKELDSRGDTTPLSCTSFKSRFSIGLFSFVQDNLSIWFCVLHIPSPLTFSNLQAAQQPVVIFEYFPERDYSISAVKTHQHDKISPCTKTDVNIYDNSFWKREKCLLTWRSSLSITTSSWNFVFWPGFGLGILSRKSPNFLSTSCSAVIWNMKIWNLYYRLTHLTNHFKQYFSVVRFTMLCKVILFLNSVDEILKCDHSYESYWAVLSFSTVYHAVQGGSKCDHSNESYWTVSYTLTFAFLDKLNRFLI